MTIYTICTVISIWWLCYRFYKFLTIPVIKIVSTLRIRTPPATKVSIDKISKNSITIHWENEPSKNKKSGGSISHFLLYLNNLQVAIFPNSPNSLYTCCSITGLKQETEYQLDFITVNHMGFINKLPSLYCMTNSSDEGQNSATLKRSGKWRRNTMTATVTLQDTPMVQTSSVNFTSPAYASLTTLQDLELYSIDDLKKILVCAQEDLHDVLSQQASLFEDFKESKIQLELELDNLRSYWSHEIDLRKSLKSNIKSLENSKLLADLKLEKLNKNIEQSKSKIYKMENDMQLWSKQDLEQFSIEKLGADYDESLKRMYEDIEMVSERIKRVQQELFVQEEKNKKLNSLKKSSNTSTTIDSTNLVGKSQAVPSSLSSSSLSLQATHVSSVEGQDTTTSLASLLRSISDHTNEKTGLLNAQGEDVLTKLDPKNQAVKMIRDQIRLDQELDNKWKSKRSRMMKRIESLESTFNEMSASNGQMRANILAQPYTSQASTSETNSQTDSSMALKESSPGLSSPPASTRSIIDTTQNGPVSLSGTYSNPVQVGIHPNLILHNPSTYTSDKPSPASGNHGSVADDSLLALKVEKDASIPHGPPTTATILANATASSQFFGWNHEQQHHQQQQQQQQHQQQQQQQEPQQQQVHSQTELEQPFEYEDASHLISGLQNMIYDETDYPESISNYSKGFTTDQLDNYWAAQRTMINGNQISPPKFSSPVTPYVNEHVPTFQFETPVSHSGQTQSLLSATLADASISGFGDGISAGNLEAYATSNTANNQSFPAEAVNDGKNLSTLISNDVDSASMKGMLSHHMPSSLESRSNRINKETSFDPGNKEEPQINGNLLNINPPKLSTPKHSFIWHASHASPSPSQATHIDVPQHHRNPSNVSNGSNSSTWSKFNWKNWSPQAAHAPEEAIDESSLTEPLITAQHRKSSSSPGNSSGRRMSKLLSRSGMNNIFKLPSHEEKKSSTESHVNT